MASVLVFVFLCGAPLFAVALLVCAVAQPDLQTTPYAAPAYLNHDQVMLLIKDRQFNTYTSNHMY
jgi:hypothetical protein